METLSIAFGMLLMLTVVLTAVVVMGIVKVNRLNESLTFLRSVVNENRDDFERSVEGAYNSMQGDRRELDHRIDQLNGYVDSRFDKMENKFNGNNAKKQING